MRTSELPKNVIEISKREVVMNKLPEDVVKMS